MHASKRMESRLQSHKPAAAQGVRHRPDSAREREVPGQSHRLAPCSGSGELGGRKRLR